MGFDFDHTLGIDNKLERVAFLRLLDEVCSSGGRTLGSLAEETVQIDALLERQRAGGCSIDEAIERFVRERGVMGDMSGYIARYKRFALRSVEHFVVPEPGVAAMLEALREAGKSYAILTNGWSPLQQHKARHAGFDGEVLVSDDLGAQKPDSETFEALARTFGVAADRTAYVGDSPQTDVAGALAAGMQGIWYDAERRAYPRGLPAPSAVIHSLAELTAVL